MQTARRQTGARLAADGNERRTTQTGAQLRIITLRYLLPVLLIGAAMLIAIYLRETRPDVPITEQKEREWPVAVVRAELAQATPEIRTYGSIVAGRKLDLRPLVAGEIIKISEEMIDGGTVSAGETLLTIDPFDFATAIKQRKADIAETRARIAELNVRTEVETALLEQEETQIKLAEREVARRQTLKRRQVGSEKALDDARMALSERHQLRLARRETIARIATQIEQETARLDSLEAALQQSEKDLSRTRLKAPFDAFVSDPDVALGKRVSTNDRLATLIELDRLEARFHLGTRDYARLISSGPIIDRPVRIIWRLGAQNVTLAGRIERQGAEIDASTGGIELFAHLEDLGPDIIIRPGAFVEVWIQERILDEVVRLPLTALGKDDRVYTVENGRLTAQTVTIIAEEEESVLVSGLTPGALVVTTRFPEIRPGLKVTTTGGS